MIEAIVAWVVDPGLHQWVPFGKVGSTVRAGAPGHGYAAACATKLQERTQRRPNVQAMKTW